MSHQLYLDLLHGLLPGIADGSSVLDSVFKIKVIRCKSCRHLALSALYHWQMKTSIQFYGEGEEKNGSKEKGGCSVCSDPSLDRAWFLAHGRSTRMIMMKLESLGLVFVRLIFHPSSSATLGMCLCIPSQLSAASSSREGRPQDGCLALHLTFAHWSGGKNWGCSVRGRMQGTRVLVILSAPLRLRNPRYKTVGCKDFKKFGKAWKRQRG